MALPAPWRLRRPATHTASGMLRRVGVGFADTAEGHAALRLGCRLARELGAEAQIIAGCGLSPTLASYASGSSSLPRIEQEIFEETKAMLERACEELDGEPVQLDVPLADPSRALVEASHQLDLLVLGSRGYGPLHHVLLGSVSAEVMHSADCPVLVLPRQVAVSREPARARPRLRSLEAWRPWPARGTGTGPAGRGRAGSRPGCCLRDGTRLTVRRVQASDEAALRVFLHGLCEDARRLRFFGVAVDMDGAAHWAADERQALGLVAHDEAGGSSDTPPLSSWTRGMPKSRSR